MDVRLIPGAFGASAGVIGGGLALAFPQARHLGLALVALGGLMFLWGVRVNGRHIWQNWQRRPRAVRKGVIPIGLDDALRYLAFESAWSQNLNQEGDDFAIFVGKALRDALANGDIRSRGRYYHELQGGARFPALHPKVDIDLAYWKRNPINAWWALNNSDQMIGGTRQPNGMPPYQDTYEGIHDIDLDRDRLKTIWPKRI